MTRLVTFYIDLHLHPCNNWWHLLLATAKEHSSGGSRLVGDWRVARALAGGMALGSCNAKHFPRVRRYTWKPCQRICKLLSSMNGWVWGLSLLSSPTLFSIEYTDKWDKVLLLGSFSPNPKNVQTWGGEEIEADNIRLVSITRTGQR